jgi:two-component system sensor histidine kinase KdpD
MTYLLGVFLVASHFGRGASIVASLLSAPAFAFYFAKPLFSFAINDLENIVGLAVMIVVANVTGSLLEKFQLQTELAQQRVVRASALYRLSRDLSDAQDHVTAAHIAKSHIDGIFTINSVLLLADTEKHLQYQSNGPLPDPLTLLDLSNAQHAFDTGIINQTPNLIYYPLKGSQCIQGVLIIQAMRTLVSPAPELITFMDTLCHLIAQTLERLQLAEQAREAALQADTEALRNALLSSISHDLRTPLTRIIGAASTLIENISELPSPERQDLQLVLAEAQHMSELTDKLLDMARLSSGQIVLHRDWNFIEEIVGSALHRLDKALLDRPVHTLLSDNLPLLWVDAVLMEQVLVNLIENAIKYTPQGSPIDIEASSLPTSLRLFIVDYGPGIIKENAGKLFDKFYRGNPESGQNGVGLGLALCKVIVEAHGGRIQAGNRSGKGAEFVIELPLLIKPPVLTDENANEV